MRQEMTLAKKGGAANKFGNPSQTGSRGITQPVIKMTYCRMAHKMLIEKHIIQERKRSYEEIPIVDADCGGLDID